MNLGKNCFRRAFNNFKFHLHGLKRYVKKHLPRRPPPFPGPNARPGLTPQEPLALTDREATSLLHQIFQSEVVFEGVGVFQGFVGDGLHGLYGEEAHVGGDEDVGEGGEPCQVVILDDFV